MTVSHAATSQYLTKKEASRFLLSTEKLQREKQSWHLIYPEFTTKVRVEQWSGASALVVVMPRFATIHE